MLNNNAGQTQSSRQENATEHGHSNYSDTYLASVARFNDTISRWQDMKRRWNETSGLDRLRFYTNLVSQTDEYLTHFLEKPSDALGISRCGKSENYIVYRKDLPSEELYSDGKKSDA